MVIRWRDSGRSGVSSVPEALQFTGVLEASLPDLLLDLFPLSTFLDDINAPQGPLAQTKAGSSLNANDPVCSP